MVLVCSNGGADKRIGCSRKAWVWAKAVVGRYFDALLELNPPNSASYTPEYHKCIFPNIVWVEITPGWGIDPALLFEGVASLYSIGQFTGLKMWLVRHFLCKTAHIRTLPGCLCVQLSKLLDFPSTPDTREGVSFHTLWLSAAFPLHLFFCCFSLT